MEGYAKVAAASAAACYSTKPPNQSVRRSPDSSWKPLHLSPFSKAIEALRKLRRAFCGRGSREDPLLIIPLFASQGGKEHFNRRS